MEISKVEKLTKMIPEVLLVGMNISNRGILNKEVIFSEIGIYVNNSLNILSQFDATSLNLLETDILYKRLELAILMGENIINLFKNEITRNLEWEYIDIFPVLNDTLNSVFFQEPFKEEVEEPVKWK
jgi:hypothetical protein